MSEQKKTKIYLQGLTCVACENIIKEETESISGVVSVQASAKTQTAEIIYEQELAWPAIKQTIEKLGYQAALKTEDLQPKKKASLEQWLYAVLLVFGLYLVYRYLHWIGLLDWLKIDTNTINYSSAFFIGLVASLSSCLVVVGAVVLSFGAKYQSQNNSLLAQSKPHLLFHLGRLATFALGGGILGLIGSWFSLSGAWFTYLTIIVALILLSLALNILGLMPPLTKFGLHLPKVIFKPWNKLKNSQHYLAPLLLGFITFFLPCGFTQSMQLFALAQADFSLGAMTLFLFALGTMPVLFILGLSSTKIRNLKNVVLEKALGLIILLFALYTLLAGLSHYGLGLPFFYKNQNQAVVSQDNIQTINMAVTYNGFEPNVFQLKKDVPVRWLIDGQQISGCTSQIIVPDLKITKDLVAGENIVEFTPTKSGKINFSCWMGMVRGQFIVE